LHKFIPQGGTNLKPQTSNFKPQTSNLKLQTSNLKPSATQRIIIITAPSGAGKTSITHYLLDKYPELGFSVSAATRAPRGTEVDGKDYHFMSVADFQQKIEANEFVEWEMVYEGKYYGTLRSELEKLWGQGKTPLLDIDVKGAIHVQRQFPATSLSLFIQPPSIEELKRRLQSRGTETEASLQARINKASYEISFKEHFNCIITNDVLAQACHEAEAAICNFTGIALRNS
jgi:guanylate kinase